MGEKPVASKALIGFISGRLWDTPYLTRGVVLILNARREVPSRGKSAGGRFRKIPPCTVGSLTFLSFFFPKDEGRPPGQRPPERARKEQARQKPQNSCNLILDIPALLCFLLVRSRTFGPAHTPAKTIPQGHRGEDHGAIVESAYQFTACGNEYVSGECDFGSVGATNTHRFIGQEHPLSGYLEEIGPLGGPLIYLTLSYCTLCKPLCFCL